MKKIKMAKRKFLDIRLIYKIHLHFRTQSTNMQ